MPKEKEYRKKTEVIAVVAKDDEGNVKGTGKVKVYAENQAGLEEAIKDVGVPSFVRDYNRQKTTDMQNDLRRTKSVTKSFVDKVKTNAKFREFVLSSPEVDEDMKELVREIMKQK